MHRRGFLENATALAVGGAIWPQGGQAEENTAALKPRRATLAQVAVHKNVEQNLVNARRAIEQAAAEKGDFVLFPEMFLTGYARGIRQDEATAGMAEIAEMCRKFAVTALVGTAWQEEDKLFNQVRIIDATGAPAGVYAKKCLTYGDAKSVSAGTTPLGNLSVPIGTHEIVWHHPQLGDRRQTVTVKSQSPARAAIDYSRP